MEAVATDAPWLMATAVAMDSYHRLQKKSLKRHVADVKNIAGDDQLNPKGQSKFFTKKKPKFTNFF